MGGSKEIVGPYEVSEEEKCRCILPAPRTGLHYQTGYGMTDCAKCKKWIKWGVSR